MSGKWLCAQLLLPDGRYMPECRADGATAPVVVDSFSRFCPCCGEESRRGVATSREARLSKIATGLGG